MDNRLDIFLATISILFLAVMIGFIILAIVTALVNKATAKTTVECPLDCEHCKDGMCKLKDVKLVLLINSYKHEGMFCKGFKQKPTSGIDLVYDSKANIKQLGGELRRLRGKEGK